MKTVRNSGLGGMAMNKILAGRTAGGAGSTPDAATLDSYNVNVAGLRNAKVQPLYDSLVLANGAVGPQNFFNVPVGGAKTLADTNLRQNGQLPTGVSHFTTGISARILPTAALASNRLADLRAVGEAGFFQFNILDVEKYAVAPFSSIPARVSIEGAQAMHGAAVDVANDFGFSAYVGEDVDFLPFHIQAGQSFNAVLNFNTALVLTANVRVVVYLHGLMYSPVS